MKVEPPRRSDTRLQSAEQRVTAARAGGDPNALIRNLKELANVQRRKPQMRDAANETYREIAEISRRMGEQLEAAWAIRHIGINHENAGDLVSAEECYDESLAIFREHAHENSLNYANSVRYSAVIKHRLGKIEESERLWIEAFDRYEQVELPIGAAEAAANLAGLALGAADPETARNWLAKAEVAAAAAGDEDTDKMMAALKKRFSSVERG